jgi:hypothetical protein
VRRSSVGTRPILVLAAAQVKGEIRSCLALSMSAAQAQEERECRSAGVLVIADADPPAQFGYLYARPSSTSTYSPISHRDVRR